MTPKINLPTLNINPDINSKVFLSPKLLDQFISLDTEPEGWCLAGTKTYHLLVFQSELGFSLEENKIAEGFTILR